MHFCLVLLIITIVTLQHQLISPRHRVPRGFLLLYIYTCIQLNSSGLSLHANLPTLSSMPSSWPINMDNLQDLPLQLVIIFSHGVTLFQVITPWRLPEFFNRFKGRVDLFEYAKVWICYSNKHIQHNYHISLKTKTIRKTSIHLSLIFIFFKCLSLIPLCLAKSSETWLYNYFFTPSFL